MILEAIKAYWDYQKPDREPGYIGMSALGHCGRQLAYTHHQIPGAPLDARAKVIFDDGNRHHDQVRKAIREGLVLNNSCYNLVDEELEVNLGMVVGHVDGRLVHSLECKQEAHKDLLLEVKSMNERGFEQLKRTKVLGKEYAAQSSAYLRATGMTAAMIVAKNKNTGEILTLQYQEDVRLLDDRLDILSTVYESESAEDVPREYTYLYDGSLPWQCNYCPFTMICWRHEGVVQQSVHKFVIPGVSSDRSNAKNKKKSEKTNGTEVATKSKDDGKDSKGKK